MKFKSLEFTTICNNVRYNEVYEDPGILTSTIPFAQLEKFLKKSIENIQKVLKQIHTEDDFKWWVKIYLSLDGGVEDKVHFSRDTSQTFSGVPIQFQFFCAYSEICNGSKSSILQCTRHKRYLEQVKNLHCAIHTAWYEINGANTEDVLAFTECEEK